MPFANKHVDGVIKKTDVVVWKALAKYLIKENEETLNLEYEYLYGLVPC